VTRSHPSSYVRLVSAGSVVKAWTRKAALSSCFTTIAVEKYPRLQFSEAEPAALRSHKLASTHTTCYFSPTTTDQRQDNEVSQCWRSRHHSQWALIVYTHGLVELQEYIHMVLVSIASAVWSSLQRNSIRWAQKLRPTPVAVPSNKHLNAPTGKK
jgi:hypothetical protein